MSAGGDVAVAKAPVVAEEPARFFPLGLRVRDQRCVVVGGGAVGTRKALTLERAGARVVVVSPEIAEGLGEAISQGRVEWIPERFRKEHLDGALLVVAATGDPAVNGAVAELGSRAGVLVCDASSAARSRVVFGATVQRDEATVAVFTDGRDPARARRTRDRIAAWLQADARRNGTDEATSSRATRADASPTTLVLMAHGSRDARWRASVERMIEALRERLGGEAVQLAYMDFTPPTLMDVARAAAEDGGGRGLRVLPVFLAQEGHVERDVVPLVEEVRRAWPGLDVELLPALGQLPEFSDAVARIAGRTSQHTSSDAEVSTP